MEFNCLYVFKGDSPIDLRLIWHCAKDTLGYRYRPVEYKALTLRNDYRVLATQYDPIGFLIPFTTRAKVLLQQLWIKERQWDDPILPEGIQKAWSAWENELPDITSIQLSRSYGPLELDGTLFKRELHIFCGAYGSVAYLRIVNYNNEVLVSFLMARSRVCNGPSFSIPRLELCADLTEVQLANLLQRELDLHIQQIILRSDSMTVLNWI